MMDKEMKSRITRIVQRTFEVIASDMEAACEATGEKMTLKDMSSVVLDYVSEYGGDKEAAQALLAQPSLKAMQSLTRPALRQYF